MFSQMILENNFHRNLSHPSRACC